VTDAPGESAVYTHETVTGGIRLGGYDFIPPFRYFHLEFFDGQPVTSARSGAAATADDALPIVMPAQAWWEDVWMRGRSRTEWWGVVLEAADGVALANFYASLLGWPVVKQENGEAAIAVPGTSSYLAFQSSPGYVPPVWPAADGRQQMMMHIDIAIDDLAAAVADAMQLGATLAEFQPQEDVRVLLDPAGHPFCLYLDHDLD
jgi:catechol 2,3-dioxygenase-like lactoylglutathione lyase family enzyme